MPKAIALDENGQEVTVANSDEVVYIEGNAYFPPDSVNKKLLKNSSAHTVCFWKGKASYKTVQAGGKEYPDAAWYYPKPEPDAIERVGKDFSGYFAFWRGVEIKE